MLINERLFRFLKYKFNFKPYFIFNKAGILSKLCFKINKSKHLCTIRLQKMQIFVIKKLFIKHFYTVHFIDTKIR